jgi:hypothetical protein
MWGNSAIEKQCEAHHYVFREIRRSYGTNVALIKCKYLFEEIEIIENVDGISE